jgi:hypothetical protein
MTRAYGGKLHHKIYTSAKDYIWGFLKDLGMILTQFWVGFNSRVGFVSGDGFLEKYEILIK